jgi:hypothetical protein
VTWKPYRNDSAPATDGYYIGNFSDGTGAYVGLGYVPNGNIQPGRLRISSPPEPAVYLTYAGAQYAVTTNIFYMSVSPNCACSYGPIGRNTSGAVMVRCC